MGGITRDRIHGADDRRLSRVETGPLTPNRSQLRPQISQTRTNTRPRHETPPRNTPRTTTKKTGARGRHMRDSSSIGKCPHHRKGVLHGFGQSEKILVSVMV
jgi:hypothetical protein